MYTYCSVQARKECGTGGYRGGFGVHWRVSRRSLARIAALGEGEPDPSRPPLEPPEPSKPEIDPLTPPPPPGPQPPPGQPPPKVPPEVPPAHPPPGHPIGGPIRSFGEWDETHDT